MWERITSQGFVQRAGAGENRPKQAVKGTPEPKSVYSDEGAGLPANQGGTAGKILVPAQTGMRVFIFIAKKNGQRRRETDDELSGDDPRLKPVLERAKLHNSTAIRLGKRGRDHEPRHFPAGAGA